MKPINRICLTLGLCAYLGIGVTHAQTVFDRFKKAVDKNVSSDGNKNGGLGNLSKSEISAGLKQALEIGAKQAAGRLSKKDGFFRNAAVKILMPPEARKAASTLRSMGMGNLVDDAVLRMNRAAEDAAKKAAPIFIDAIKGITIQDGIHILRGNNNAATLYLKRKTSTALTRAFSPVIRNSLNKVNAPQIWRTVFETYNQVPFVKKINPDLVRYVTDRALKGLFTEIAQEELKIRQNPAARVTDLLKRVFGNL